MMKFTVEISLTDILLALENIPDNEITPDDAYFLLFRVLNKYPYKEISDVDKSIIAGLLIEKLGLQVVENEVRVMKDFNRTDTD